MFPSDLLQMTLSNLILPDEEMGNPPPGPSNGLCGLGQPSIWITDCLRKTVDEQTQTLLSVDGGYAESQGFRDVPH